MRIAFISTIFSYPWGGADALWTSAAEYAVKRGDSVLVAIGADTARHPRIEELEKKGANILIRHPKPISGGRLAALRDLKWKMEGGKDIREEFQKWKPERVVVSQGGVMDFLHDSEAFDWSERAGIPYEIICQSNSDWFSVPSEDYEKAKDRALRARRLWFVSEQNRKIAEIQFSALLPNSKIIQNPIDLPSPSPLPWPDAPPWSLAVVSRLDAVCKGLDLLFPALANVIGQEGGWKLSVFGRGRDERYLRDLAKFTGLENKIHFGGYAKDVKSVWERHHLLLLPSRLEGCALAMLEAMAYGRPVLTTKVGGAAEWIREKEDGFLCPAVTLDALCETIAEAWAARDQWRRMGESATARYHSLRDPEPGKTLVEDFK